MQFRTADRKLHTDLKEYFLLQGIELGNYLIKEVAGEITTEFPAVQQLSSLSPIPNFKSWLLDKLKQGNYWLLKENINK